jgi:hypothetical protein
VETLAHGATSFRRLSLVQQILAVIGLFLGGSIVRLLAGFGVIGSTR